MANITDPSAVAFCNSTVRPIADQYGKLYYAIKLMVESFNAKGLNALIPNDPAAIVVDGAATDGRTQISGADVQIMIANMQAFVASAEASTNLILNQTAKVWVNPK